MLFIHSVDVFAAYYMWYLFLAQQILTSDFYFFRSNLRRKILVMLDKQHRRLIL